MTHYVDCPESESGQHRPVGDRCAACGSTLPVQPVSERQAGDDVSAILVNEPLLASAVIERMQALIAQFGDLPVFVLDMDPDADGPDEHEWDCLVTHVDYDVMSDEQGPVILLTAWRQRAWS